MDNNINEKALKYVEATSKALGVAMKMAEDRQVSEKEAAEKVPSLVELLKKAGLIDEADEKRASAQLANQSQSLDILSNVLNHFQGELKEAQAKVASATLGSGVSEKAASAEKNANYVGQRRGFGDDRESDQAMLRLIGKH
jgi:hypothetical protein